MTIRVRPSFWRPLLGFYRTMLLSRRLDDTEVIDLRSLLPSTGLDRGESVKRTNRVIVAHEDSLPWGIGSEIAARIADELFPWLDAPVKRVASLDTWVAYAPQMERAILPEPDDVFRAIKDIKAF